MFQNPQALNPAMDNPHPILGLGRLTPAPPEPSCAGGRRGHGDPQRLLGAMAHGNGLAFWTHSVFCIQ